MSVSDVPHKHDANCHTQCDQLDPLQQDTSLWNDGFPKADSLWNDCMHSMKIDCML